MDNSNLDELVQTPVSDEKNSDSADSMTTGTSSKISSSRPERERGPKRKAKKTRRAQEHYEKLGKVWKDKEQLKQEAAELALPGMHGSVASSTYTAMLEDKHLEPLPNALERELAIANALVKEIPLEMSKWVRKNEIGEPRCFLCNKSATEGHLKSCEHLKRIEEDAIGTLMCGNAESARRFNGDLCTGVPTVKKMREFWGDALENLPNHAMAIHIEKGVFYDGKKRITPAKAQYELGIVSYPGTGKYSDTSIYLPFHELPDSEDVADEKQMRITSPPGQGWWPVIALQSAVVGEGEERKKKVLIVCWYQLLSDGRIIAWWIFI